MNLLEVLAGANVALRLIQARLITILALLLTAALFGWAMWLQTVLGAIIAAAWGLSIFLPVLFMGKGGSDAPEKRVDPADESPARGTQGE